VSAEAPDAFELARGLRVVAALLVSERFRRVGGHAAGRLLEVRFGDQPRPRQLASPANGRTTAFAHQ